MAPTWFPLFLYVELIESQASLYREPDSENYYRVIPATAPVEMSATGRGCVKTYVILMLMGQRATLDVHEFKLVI